MRSELYTLNNKSVIRLKKATKSDSDAVVWVGDWMTHLGIFSDAQVHGALNHLRSVLEDAMEEFQLVKEPYPRVIVISDSRWVSGTGLYDFYDALEDQVVDRLDQCAVTHISCDVIALFRKMQTRRDKFNAASTKPDSE